MTLNNPLGASKRFVDEGEPFPPEERELRTQQPDTAALYVSQRPRLLGFLRRWTARDRADDLVQQTFVRFIARASAPGTPIECPEGFLRRTARNLAINAAETARVRSDALHIELDEVDLPAPDQLAALEARDMLARLDLALQRLPVRTREIFLAHRIDGYSYGEIARRTGLGVKTVEKHMSRAIAHIDRFASAR